MTLSRPRKGRVLAGVCAGLARRFGWDVTLVRILFIALIILPPSAIIPYIILWIIMPEDEVEVL